MKNLKKSVSNIVLKFIKQETKNDLNSTGSTWAYQPKLPKMPTNEKNDK